MPDDCIYCREIKPFTAEHVVSAGIGGDDPDWMLKDCVCGDCNTKVFSPLETRTFRSSPLALSRIFLQPQTRTRTGKGSTPTIQPQASYHADPDTGVMFEQVMHAGGQPTLLAQVLVSAGGSLIASVPDVTVGRLFIKTIKDRLGQNVSVVRKVRNGAEVRFERTSLVWASDELGFQVDGEVVSSTKAPREPIIWVEEPIWPAGVKVGDYTKLPPRLFRRDSGQICCRAAAMHIVAGLLSILRCDIDQITITGDEKPSAVQAHVHQRFSFDMKSYDRVLAKIGMNLCAKIIGADFVRHAAFDQVRNYVHHGESAIYKIPPDKIDGMKNALGPVLKNHHVLLLSGGQSRISGGQSVIFFCRLYGGPIEIFSLADLNFVQEELKRPVVIVVDYLSESIQRMSLEEFALFASLNSFRPIEEFWQAG